MPPITQYNMDGLTYRYLHGAPLYPFGYGLSYSTFEYSDLALHPTKLKPGQDLNVVVNVVNKGPYDADEVRNILNHNCKCIQYIDYAIDINHIAS